METKILDRTNLVTQADAVLYFLQRMDVEMVSSILDDNRTYQDFAKHVFIRKLDNAIDCFIKSGDTFLNYYCGFCNSKICNFQCNGYSFVGNHSRNYFDLIVDIKDGIVYDIYECTLFSNFDIGIEKKLRIGIDKP